LIATATIGIVGVGQVGLRVAKTCALLGMKVLLNDPPRERLEGPSQFVSLRSIQDQADSISFHVPLNMEGMDKTCHMVSEEASYITGQLIVVDGGNTIQEYKVSL